MNCHIASNILLCDKLNSSWGPFQIHSPVCDFKSLHLHRLVVCLMPLQFNRVIYPIPLDHRADQVQKNALRLEQDITVIIGPHMFVHTTLSRDIHCYLAADKSEGARSKQRDTNVLEGPDCQVQWKERVLHYVWRLLFSSQGSSGVICSSCPVSIYCHVFTDCCFGVCSNLIPSIDAKAAPTLYFIPLDMD